MTKIHKFMVLLLLVLNGCATYRDSKLMTPQETNVLRDRLGTIGVVEARYVPKLDIQTPSKGAKQGAVDGAIIGAAWPTMIGLGLLGECVDVYCLWLPVVGLALTPVGAVVGAVIGAVTADSAEVVSAREAELEKAIPKLRLQEGVNDQLASRLADLKTFPFSVLSGVGPTQEGEKPDYRELKDQGIGTIHEVAVKKLGLTGGGKIKPDLSLHLEVQMRLISTQENTEIYCEVLTCSSVGHNFAVWAIQEGKRLNDEAESCYAAIAGWTVSDLYLEDSVLRTKTKRKRGSPRRSVVPCDTPQVEGSF